MRRFLSVLLVLAITLCCLPCGAAEAGLKTPFSEDAVPTLLDTGRGYIAYSFYASAIYYSSDGAAWTDLSDRQWVQDARVYIALTSPMAHREFQLIWTGTEYMMRQDLRDDPRSTHQRYGDSPRNSLVTFLDEELQIIGELPFGSPVTGIRYGDGVYYATVDGSEIAFTREEWAAGAAETATFSDVPADAWYAQGVKLCAERGVMIGTGEGTFSPDEVLTRNQCVTLALRLHDLLQGGDGEFEPAPEDWGKITLTLDDGTKLTSYGKNNAPLPGLEGGSFSFGWWSWGMMGNISADYFQVSLNPIAEPGMDLGSSAFWAAQEPAHDWGKAHEGAATVTVGDTVIPGTVNCWLPVASWALAFHPDDDEDNAKREAIRAVLNADAPALDAWWRDGAWYRAQQEELKPLWDSYLSFAKTDSETTRLFFARALAEAVGELPALRQVELPDMSRDGAPEVYALYESGILTGTDAYGTFDGEGVFTRAQAAVMVARVLDETLRVSAPLSTPEEI